VATLSARAAIAKLEAAIEFGELAVQHQPGGHPLYAAIADAREVLAWVTENASILPDMAEGTRVRVHIDQAIEAINASAATTRNDPDKPLPVTIWPQIQQLPWPWIAAGVGGLVLVAILFQRRAAA
jgi:hypothetical protein